MKKIDILHIYAGTSGSAGLYINEVYTSLSENFSQELIVNYYYSFPEGKKVFYKFSELSAPYKFKWNKTRLFIRFLELCVALTYSVNYLIVNKVKLLNYNLTSDLFVEYCFLRLIKLITKTKILITCHDVIPFGISSIELFEKKQKKKKRFFLLADYLIVHNENSKTDLKKYYKIEANILEHPFPLMDLKKLFKEIPDPGSLTIKNHFLVGMFGHFRKEKGLDLLLQAWKSFYEESKNVELLLAGNFPPKYLKTIEELKIKGVKIIPRFIDDKSYYNYIASCDLVVLPYTRGTNTGIPSSIISLNTLVLTSDIPMFKNNKLLCSKQLFEANNPIDLEKKLDFFYTLSPKEKKVLVKENMENFFKYKNSFKSKVNDAYFFALKKLNK